MYCCFQATFFCRKLFIQHINLICSFFDESYHASATLAEGKSYKLYNLRNTVQHLYRHIRAKYRTIEQLYFLNLWG